MISPRNKLGCATRFGAESWFRRRARNQNLGNGQIACRILGDRKFCAPTSDLGFSSHAKFGGYGEFRLTKFFADGVAPGSMTIDIGANPGYSTMLAADPLGETGDVVPLEPGPLEPGPEIFVRLQNGVGTKGCSPRVKALNCALSFGQENARKALGANQELKSPGFPYGVGNLSAGMAASARHREDWLVFHE